jgi:hypothetical protein
MDFQTAGGAIALEHGLAVLDCVDCRFFNNTVTGQAGVAGGAVATTSADILSLTNCAFVENVAIAGQGAYPQGEGVAQTTRITTLHERVSLL